MWKNTMAEGQSVSAKTEELSASEALFGFTGWLTTRKEKTVMSSTDDCAIIVGLVTEFCKVQNLKEPRENWDKKLKPLNS